MKKILIVEDEIKLRNELKELLSNYMYEVEVIESFDNTLEIMCNSKVDLILLDINLPNTNGETLLKEYRKVYSTPIIMLTSKNTELDELLSINYGADDYITKPFSSQILVARIDRLLNRVNNVEKIDFNGLVLDISKSVLEANGQSVDLSKNEFKILHYLLINRGKIMSRDDIMNYLWDTNEFIDDNTLTVNINRLRSKLDSLGYSDIISTKRGQGYIIL